MPSSSGWEARRHRSPPRPECFSRTPTTGAIRGSGPSLTPCPHPVSNRGGEHAAFGRRAQQGPRNPAQNARRKQDCIRRRGEVVPVRSVRKPWWQQATALVTVSTGGVITGLNFIPGAATTMTSPTSVPLHLLALEQAAQPGTFTDLAVGGGT